MVEVVLGVRVRLNIGVWLDPFTIHKVIQSLEHTDLWMDKLGGEVEQWSYLMYHNSTILEQHRAEPEKTAGIMHLIWPMNASGSPRKSWKMWLERLDEWQTVIISSFIERCYCRCYYKVPKTVSDTVGTGVVSKKSVYAGQDIYLAKAEKNPQPITGLLIFKKCWRLVPWVVTHRAAGQIFTNSTETCAEICCQKQHWS